ncbi:unnamed protein product, partial [Heterosigma akashiwo]
VNESLVSAANRLNNPRCLVLDGPNAQTAQALRDSQVLPREKHDIVVPNCCAETYLAIWQLEVCTPYFGSLRAYIDENAAAPAQAKWSFGFVYLDYCSSLYSGFKSIETSPLEDIKAIFSSSTLDKNCAVVAVTLADPPERSG